MADLPIVCTFSPSALAARRQGFLADLLRRAEAHQEGPDVRLLRFRAENETLAAIARAVDAERRCCQFLRFLRDSEQILRNVLSLRANEIERQQRSAGTVCRSSKVVQHHVSRISFGRIDLVAQVEDRMPTSLLPIKTTSSRASVSAA